MEFQLSHLSSHCRISSLIKGEVLSCFGAMKVSHHLPILGIELRAFTQSYALALFFFYSETISC